MHYAIVAAGEGSRMVHEVVALPKPLVELEGKPMIGRLIDLFASYEPESLTIIINNSMNDVRQYLESIVSGLAFPVEIIQKDTSGSMESVYEVSHAFDRGKTVLSTVDSVFSRDEWNKFIRDFAANMSDDGLFPVTDFIDDEKPLYVDTDAEGYITAFRDEPSPNDFYISGGIYGITPECNKVLARCRERGVHSLRGYQRTLVAEGLRLKAYPFSKIVDVDHAGDIDTARAFLAECNQ